MALIAHYRLDGDASDAIGGHPTLSFTNTNYTYTGAVLGQGVNLANSQAYLPDNNGMLKNTHSVSLWFNKRTSPSYECEFAIDGVMYFREYNNTIQVRVWTDESGDSGNVIITSGVLYNTWYNVVVTYDTQSVRCYLNGTYVGGFAFYGKLSTNSNPLLIGGRNAVGSYLYDGQIDDVRIYDHALSEREVRDLYLTRPTINLFPVELRRMSGTTGWVLAHNSFIQSSFLFNVFGRDHVHRIYWDGSESGDWYSRITLDPTQVGDVFCFSYDYFVAIGTDIPNNPIFYQDGWKEGGEATREFLYDVPTTDGWRRRVYRFTVTTAGTPVLRMSTGYTSNIWEVYLDNYQLEKTYEPNEFFDGKNYYSKVLPYSETKASLDSVGNFHTQSLQEYTEYDESIDASNLVENGYQQLEDNTNFPNFTYSSSSDSLSITSGSNNTKATGLIPVRGNGFDQFEQYKISHEIKGETESSNYYFYIDCYDKYKNSIEHQMVFIYEDTHTTLAQDLVAGDTWVYLNDITNWQDDGTSNYAHTKTLLLWKEGDDPIYTPYKYSRRDNRVTEVDKVNNRLALESPYSGETIPAGSPAANSRRGSVYSYIGAVNKTTDLSNWVYDEGLTSSTDDVNSMRYGSYYFRVGWLINRNATNPTTLVRNVRAWNTESPQEQYYSYHKMSISEKSSAYNISEVGVTRGLVAYYPLMGDTKDYAGGNDGTNNGAVATVDGYSFDGVDDYIESNYIPSPAVTAMSFSALIKPSNIVSNGNDVINNYGGGGASNHIICGFQNGKVGMFVDDGGVGEWFTYDKTIGTDLHHVVWVYNNLDIVIYVNGVAYNAGTYAYSDPDLSQRSFRIGGRQTNLASLFPGIISHIKIHNVALTPEEVAIEYNLLMGNGTRMSVTEENIYLNGQAKEVVS
jgi:hypothetical protein